jgi:transcriptional regulator with XRE-family HTH domain
MTVLREQRGMSQEELAAASQVSLKWLGYMERTSYASTAKTRARIAAALGVTEADVWPVVEATK